MKKYLGFEFQDTPETKAGEPNPHTKRLSTAGALYLFESMKHRTDWIIKNPEKRIAVKNNEARKLHCGLTDIQFAEKISCLLAASQNT